MRIFTLIFFVSLLNTQITVQDPGTGSTITSLTITPTSSDPTGTYVRIQGTFNGEFHVPQEISLILDVAKKEHGLRVHGLLVSNGHYGAASMHQICSPLHIFKDWAEIRGL